MCDEAIERQIARRNDPCRRAAFRRRQARESNVAIGEHETGLGIVRLLGNDAIEAHASAGDEDKRILRVNVHGGWNVAQAAWRPMQAQGYGRIVMTGSGAGFFGRRRDHAYSVAKSALMALTKVLAAEGAPLGIRAA